MPMRDLYDMYASEHAPEARRAIQRTIGEHDEIGRVDFLAKYGFRPALSYFLRYAGRHYDSKAIVGVAYGRLFPDRGYMRSADFSGGRRSVIQVLENLGFDWVQERQPDRPDDGEVEDGFEALEGKEFLAQHLRRERSPKLVEAKKRGVLRTSGQLACEVCEFDFQRAYGSHGAGYIECHHTNPLALRDGESPTRLEDLALVCANCHRMLHCLPLLSIDGLRRQLLERG